MVAPHLKNFVVILYKGPTLAKTTSTVVPLEELTFCPFILFIIFFPDMVINIFV